MIQAGLLIVATVLAAIAVLGASWDLIQKTQVFWPPKSAAHQRRFVWLFRVMVYTLVAATVIHLFSRPLAPPLSATLFGGALIGAGLTAAFAATLQMGWSNAFGSGERLVTTGWFKLCRHPVYLSSFAFLLGWALIAWSFPFVWPLCLWATAYLIAPHLEEPWLSATFGSEYDIYRKNTPMLFPDLHLK